MDTRDGTTSQKPIKGFWGRLTDHFAWTPYDQDTIDSLRRKEGAASKPSGAGRKYTALPGLNDEEENGAELGDVSGGVTLDAPDATSPDGDGNNDKEDGVVDDDDDCPPVWTQVPCASSNCPEEWAPIWKKLTFWWLGPLLALGAERPLKHTDMWKLPRFDRASRVSPEFHSAWNAMAAEGKRPTLFKVLHRTVGPWFYSMGLIKLAHDLLMFIPPIMLRRIIYYIESRPVDDPWTGFLYVIILYVAASTQSMLIHYYFYNVYRVGMHARAMIIANVYQKSLRLSPSARSKHSVGEIVNLMSNDSQRITDMTQYLHLIWSAPFQVILCLYLLWQVIGAATLAGVAVLILLVPINARVARRIEKLRKSAIVHTDARVKIMNEVLQAMRAIKLYVWEEPFTEKVSKVRREELKNIRGAAIVRAATSFIWSGTPLMVSVASFSVLVFLGGELDPAVAFGAVALFNLLRFPLAFIPMLINTIIEMRVSGKRIQEFMESEELVSGHRIGWDGGPAPGSTSAGAGIPYYTKETYAAAQADAPYDPSSAANSDSHAGFGDVAHAAQMNPDRQAVPVSLQSASFRWSMEDADSVPPVLKKVTLEVKAGELIGVVGVVGSGKTSLLSALLGEMKRTEGAVRLCGRVAYVAQTAWILNDTMRRNITFGLPWDEERYHDTIRSCALASDIEMLPGGDMIEIGEKGITLSGGQKQRIALARAVYNDADVYLLDDPLSAVDAHVGRHLFDACIDGQLKGKTRILATHQTQYLNAVDRIVVMKGGEIDAIGSYQELTESGYDFSAISLKSPTASVPSTPSGSDDGKGSKDKDEDEKEGKKGENADGGEKTGEGGAQVLQNVAAASGKGNDEQKKSGALVKEEERAVGSLKAEVLSAYVAAAGGWTRMGLVIAFYIGSQSLMIGSDWWLSVWSSSVANPSAETHSMWFYLGIYTLWGIGACILFYSRSIILAVSTARAAWNLHSSLFNRVFGAPMRFFDTTPVGRIVNRFAKDIDTMDSRLNFTISGFFNTVVVCLSTLFVIMAVTPAFTLALVPLGWVYYKVQKYYRASSRELKRLDSVSKSPVYAHFSETLGGITTIRAYGVQGRFITSNQAKLDYNHRAFVPSHSANRWLGQRLEFVGNTTVFLAGLLLVFEREHLDPGLAGLSLTYALSVTGWLSWLVRMSAQAETEFNCVERVLEYTDLEQEAAREIGGKRSVPETWPHQGAISFKDVRMRYREELEDVLRGLTLEVLPREKIGVVGRTGAGKSSIAMVLMRIVELSGGSIEIDGVNIAKLGLKELREAIVIIPQDATLFSGTIRSNLDPFDRYSDAELWNSLEATELKQTVSDMPLKLGAPVTEGGENLSQGQKQLLCLARALLMRARVLIMDEATAAVDNETDGLIQSTIRTAFADCTVLTIAHRLNTIMDSDRVLVMGAGKVVEFDSPAALMEKQGAFYSLVNDMGES